jgi:Tol biopolymer transport system component
VDGSEPAWADDLNLLFASDADTADGQHDILTVRADGSNADQPSPVIAGPGDQRSPDLSPDGTKIAYVGRATGEAGPGLYIAAAEGTTPND